MPAATAAFSGNSSASTTAHQKRRPLFMFSSVARCEAEPDRPGHATPTTGPGATIDASSIALAGHAPASPR
jgi:hypothetical protein